MRHPMQSIVALFSFCLKIKYQQLIVYMCCFKLDAEWNCIENNSDVI